MNVIIIAKYSKQLTTTTIRAISMDITHHHTYYTIYYMCSNSEWCIIMFSSSERVTYETNIHSRTYRHSVVGNIHSH